MEGVEEGDSVNRVWRRCRRMGEVAVEQAAPCVVLVASPRKPFRILMMNVNNGMGGTFGSR